MTEKAVANRENEYRFQLAGYQNSDDYCEKTGKKSSEIDRWESNFVKKLQRPDGTFYYFNKEKECHK
eukprot:m.8002 g.8002  ORF g.8002 m.8002 type:complete len:67 (+) comp20254_c0_seq1:34-234(+)